MSRYLNLGLLALLVAACSGGPTKPGSGFGDAVLKLSREPAEGFGPQADEIFEATVWRNTAGTHTITGSLLVGSDSVRDSCIGLPRFDGRCLIEVPFDNRVLTPAQVTEMNRLLAAVPVETHQIDYACDPCLISRYEFDGRTEDDNPCATATEVYRQSLADIEHFLESLVPVASQ
jgi:hypothetical protein